MDYLGSIKSRIPLLLPLLDPLPEHLSASIKANVTHIGQFIKGYDSIDSAILNKYTDVVTSSFYSLISHIELNISLMYFALNRYITDDATAIEKIDINAEALDNTIRLIELYRTHHLDKRE
jgi:hypothetical protein